MHIAKVNLRICFPELSETEVSSLAKSSIESTIIGYIETVRSWCRPLTPYKTRVEIQGIEYMESALKTGKGVIMAGGHFNILDLAGAIFSLYYPINITYRPLNNPVFNRFMMKGRLSWAKQAYEPKQLKEYIQCLKNGGILWYAPDQDFGHKHSVFAPFFNAWSQPLRALPPWLSYLAQRF